MPLFEYAPYLLIPLAAGLIYGRFRTIGKANGRHALVLLVVVTFPVWLLVVAKMFNSAVLGWMFGLSLILGIPLLLLFFIGYGVGVVLNRRAMRLGGDPASGLAIRYEELACGHINPVLHGMRAARVDVRVENPQRARAGCGLDLPELERQFGQDVRNLYLERHEIDRSYHDPKSAFLYCQPCDCWLTVVHPEELRAPTPYFPVAATR